MSASTAASFFCDEHYVPLGGTHRHLSRVPIPYPARQAVWQRARRHMAAAFIADTLRTLQVTPSTIGGNAVGIWAPSEDIGVTVALHEQARNEYGSKFGLGAGELFVDVGSNLGIVTIRAAFEQPVREKIDSEYVTVCIIHKWLNLGCLPVLTRARSVLAMPCTQ